MKNLLRLLLNYNFVLLFIIFEIIAVSLTITNSKAKLNVYLTSANSITSFFFNTTTAINQYFRLKESNELLVKENKQLVNKLSVFNTQLEFVSQKIKDMSFSYMTAQVVKNSVFNTNNFITIDKGSDSGIRPDMAIVSSSGIIGITAKVSKNYSTVISILNTKLFVSAKLKKSDYFGSISWDASNYKTVILSEIPEHIKIKKGDTVVTSGYSAIFPKDITIGFVEKFEKINENNFLRITVNLSQDFKNLNYVYVIDNKIKHEKDSLENKTVEDFMF